MTTLQAWIVVGVPALVLAAALFVGRSLVRSAFGYLVLALAFLFFVTVPESRVSAGAIGIVALLLVASGRGTTAVESQQQRQGVPFRVDDPNVDRPEVL